MKSFNELAQSVFLRKDGRKIELLQKDDSLQLIGVGRSAYAFKIKGTNQVLKVFYPQFTQVANEEAEIYHLLSGIDFFPTLYDYGPNYLVIDFIDGNTLFDCLHNGVQITEQSIQEIDIALHEAKARGLNPSDVHLKNIMLTKDGRIRLIDVARFRQTKACQQWNDLKAAFNRFYKHKLFPKKLPVFLLNTIGALYKKRILVLAR
ncbi:serine/threonine protein kinase [Bacillus alkalicellulosilyticus]|uniref:serine/threonine protein kinase n=1 Tax=Alkalihalobacterium alkalicellulosilyticum TaxID=1912214 RepID=UPI000996825D|nr:serine/threonine protein kinase [Bacillus alkalicellulosilyticus]